MPIFAFQIGVGFKKTHSKVKYIFRMFISAFISEIPFLMFLNSAYLAHNPFNILKLPSLSLNICFTFALALSALYFIDLGKKNFIYYILASLPILFSLVIPMDYGIYCVLLVIISYFFQDKKILLSIGTVIIAVLYATIKNVNLQLYMLLALPFLLLYNGKKGKSFKYWFYAFYPIHMLIIALIKILA